MANQSLSQRVGTVIDRVRSIGGFLWRWEAKLRGANVGQDVLVAGRPVISVAPGSRLNIGNRVQLNSATKSNPLGCFQPCVLRTMTSAAVLDLGFNVRLSATVLVAAKEITIGEGTLFGAGAMVVDNDFHHPLGEWDWDFDCERDARPIRIGRGCFIGARAIVLKGVTLGDRVVVGAGAVVTKDVPAGYLAVGNPAKLIPPKG